MRDAVEMTRNDLKRVQATIAGELGEEHALVFGSHLLLLSDPMLLEHVERGIAAGASAAFAIDRARDEIAGKLSLVADLYIRERVEDLEDLCSRIAQSSAWRGRLRHAAGSARRQPARDALSRRGAPRPWSAWNRLRDRRLDLARRAARTRARFSGCHRRYWFARARRRGRAARDRRRQRRRHPRAERADHQRVQVPRRSERMLAHRVRGVPRSHAADCGRAALRLARQRCVRRRHRGRSGEQRRGHRALPHGVPVHGARRRSDARGASAHLREGVPGVPRSAGHLSHPRSGCRQAASRHRDRPRPMPFMAIARSAYWSTIRISCANRFRHSRSRRQDVHSRS